MSTYSESAVLLRGGLYSDGAEKLSKEEDVSSMDAHPHFDVRTSLNRSDELRGNTVATSTELISNITALTSYISSSEKYFGFEEMFEKTALQAVFELLADESLSREYVLSRLRDLSKLKIGEDFNPDSVRRILRSVINSLSENAQGSVTVDDLKRILNTEVFDGRIKTIFAHFFNSLRNEDLELDERLSKISTVKSSSEFNNEINKLIFYIYDKDVVLSADFFADLHSVMLSRGDAEAYNYRHIVMLLLSRNRPDMLAKVVGDLIRAEDVKAAKALNFIIKTMMRTESYQTEGGISHAVMLLWRTVKGEYDEYLFRNSSVEGSVVQMCMHVLDTYLKRIASEMDENDMRGDSFALKEMAGVGDNEKEPIDFAGTILPERYEMSAIDFQQMEVSDGRLRGFQFAGISPDGRYVVFKTNDLVVGTYLFDSKKKKFLSVPQQYNGSRLREICFGPSIDRLFLIYGSVGESVSQTKHYMTDFFAEAVVDDGSVQITSSVEFNEQIVFSGAQKFFYNVQHDMFVLKGIKPRDLIFKKIEGEWYIRRSAGTVWTLDDDLRFHGMESGSLQIVIRDFFQKESSDGEVVDVRSALADLLLSKDITFKGIRPADFKPIAFDRKYILFCAEISTSSSAIELPFIYDVSQSAFFSLYDMPAIFSENKDFEFFGDDIQVVIRSPLGNEFIAVTTDDSRELRRYIIDVDQKEMVFSVDFTDVDVSGERDVLLSQLSRLVKEKSEPIFYEMEASSFFLIDDVSSNVMSAKRKFGAVRFTSTEAVQYAKGCASQSAVSRSVLEDAGADDSSASSGSEIGDTLLPEVYTCDSVARSDFSLSSHETGKSTLASVSPDGRYHVYRNNNPLIGIRLYDSRTDTLVDLPRHEGRVREMSFSPYSNRLYYICGNLSTDYPELPVDINRFVCAEIIEGEVNVLSSSDYEDSREYLFSTQNQFTVGPQDAFVILNMKSVNGKPDYILFTQDGDDWLKRSIEDIPAVVTADSQGQIHEVCEFRGRFPADTPFLRLKEGAAESDFEDIVNDTSVLDGVDFAQFLRKQAIVLSNGYVLFFVMVSRVNDRSRQFLPFLYNPDKKICYVLKGKGLKSAVEDVQDLTSFFSAPFGLTSYWLVDDSLCEVVVSIDECNSLFELSSRVVTSEGHGWDEFCSDASVQYSKNPALCLPVLDGVVIADGTKVVFKGDLMDKLRGGGVKYVAEMNESWNGVLSARQNISDDFLEEDKADSDENLQTDSSARDPLAASFERTIIKTDPAILDVNVTNASRKYELESVVDMFSFSGNGKYLAYSFVDFKNSPVNSMRKKMRVMTRDLEQKENHLAPDVNISSFDFVDASDLIVFGTNSGQLGVWDIALQQWKIELTDVMDNAIENVQVSPRGDYIVCGGHDYAMSVVRFGETLESEAACFGDEPLAAKTFSFMSDSLIAVAARNGKKLLLFDIKNMKPERVVLEFRMPVTDLIYSSSDNKIYAKAGAFLYAVDPNEYYEESPEPIYRRVLDTGNIATGPLGKYLFFGGAEEKLVVYPLFGDGQRKAESFSMYRFCERLKVLPSAKGLVFKARNSLYEVEFVGEDIEMTAQVIENRHSTDLELEDSDLDAGSDSSAVLVSVIELFLDHANDVAAGSEFDSESVSEICAAYDNSLVRNFLVVFGYVEDMSLFDSRTLRNVIPLALREGLFLTRDIIEYIRVASDKGRDHETIITDLKNRISKKEFAFDSDEGRGASLLSKSLRFNYLKMFKPASFKMLVFNDYRTSSLSSGEESAVSDETLQGLRSLIMQAEKILIDQEILELDGEEKRLLLRLGADLHESVKAYARENYAGEDAYTISFRSRIRFVRDFARAYARSRENVFSLFVLSALNVYGDMFAKKEDMDVVVSFIEKVMADPSYISLFKQSRLYSNRLNAFLNEHGVRDAVRAVYEGLDFESVFMSDDAASDYAKAVDEKAEAGVYKREFYKMKRGVDVSRPVMLFKDPECYDVPRRIIDMMDGELYRMQMSPYSDRAQLIGTDIPGKDGDAYFEKSLFIKVLEDAKANPDKKYNLVFDDIDAAPAKLRVQLNQFLQTRKFEVPELNALVEWPDNVRIIMTAQKDNRIDDQAFFDRFLRKHVSGLRPDDLREILSIKGLSGKEADALVSLYVRLKEIADEFENPSFTVNVRDIIKVAEFSLSRFSQSDMSRMEVLVSEADMYFKARAGLSKDIARLEKVQKEVFEKNYRAGFNFGELKYDDGFLVVDGMRIEVGDELRRLMYGKDDSQIEKVILKQYGFVFTGQLKSVFSQMVRAYLTGSKIIRLEGPSGTGKTFIAETFARIFDLPFYGETVFGTMKLSRLSGSFKQDATGRLHMDEITKALKIISEGGVLALSELNSEPRIMWWVMQILNNPEVSLTELPRPPTDDGDIRRILEVSRDLLVVADINIGTEGRKDFHPEAQSNVPSFYVGYDFSEKENLPPAKQEFANVAMKIFEISGVALPERFARMLADVHVEFSYRLWHEKFTGEEAQTVTARELIRAAEDIAEFGENITDEDLSLVLHSHYISNWIYPGNRKQAFRFIEKTVFPGLKEISVRDIYRFNKKKGRHCLLFKDQMSGDLRDAEDRNVLRETLTMGFFAKENNLLGGFVPNSKKGEDELPFKFGLGALLRLILKARLNPDKKVNVEVLNYHRTKAGSGMMFNRMFQSGILELPNELGQRDAQRFIRELKDAGLLESVWPDLMSRVAPERAVFEDSFLDDAELMNEFLREFIGKVPQNLVFDLEAYPAEGFNVSPAELSRFIRLSLVGLSGYDHYPAESEDLDSEASQMIDVLFGVLKKRHLVNDESVVSLAHINRMLNGVRDYLDNNGFDRNEIWRVIKSTMLCSLKPDVVASIEKIIMGRKTDPAVHEKIRYVEDEDGVYLQIGDVRKKTQYSSRSQVDELDLLGQASELLRVEGMMLDAIASGEAVVLEGVPGVGKTRMAEDLARRLGLESYISYMHQAVDISELIGRYVKVSDGQYVLSALREIEKGGKLRPFVDFLDAFQNGGIYIIDEGAIGERAKELIAWLYPLVRGDETLYLQEHMGDETIALKRHPDFHLVITTNPAGDTEGRDELPAEVRKFSRNIWVSDDFSEEDYRLILDGVVSDSDVWNEFEKMVAIHDRVRRLSGLGGDHKERYTISLRELISWFSYVDNHYDENGDESVFQGFVKNYMAGMLYDDDVNRTLTIIKEYYPGFDLFYRKWTADIRIDETDAYIDFGGVRVKKSDSSKSGEWTEPSLFGVRSYNMALRNIVLALETVDPGAVNNILVLAESATEVSLLLEELCVRLGYDFHQLDCHPQMSAFELLGGLMPEFDEMDAEGYFYSEAGADLVDAPGFLGRFLLSEDEYYKRKGQENKKTILFMSEIDAVPEKYRTVLNDFLLNGYADIERANGKKERMYLMPGATIISSMDSESEEEFSSAFYNRHLKVALKTPKTLEEQVKILLRRYDLSKEEVLKVLTLTSLMVKRNDEGLWSEDYGFSFKDADVLGRAVSLEKQRSGVKANASQRGIVNFKHVFRAAYRVFGNALREDSGAGMSDKDFFKQRIMPLVFAEEFMDIGGGLNGDDFTAFTVKIQDDILDSVSNVEYEDVYMEVRLPDVGEAIKLQNGIVLMRKSESGLVVATPRNVYEVDLNEMHDLQSDEVWLSSTFSVSVLNENALSVHMRLPSSIGGCRIPMTGDSGDFYKSVYSSLPPDEVPEDAYLYYSDSTNSILGSVIDAFNPRSGLSEGRFVSRVVNIVGERGGGKSTIGPHLASILGWRSYLFSVNGQSKVSDILVGFGKDVRPGRDGFVKQVKDFLASVGKINGEVIGRNEKELAGNVVLTVDEVNMCPELLYVLAQIVQGKKDFTVEFPGEEPLAVEMIADVHIVLTMNPDSYAERKALPSVIAQNLYKLWMRDPENADPEEIVDMTGGHLEVGIQSQGVLRAVQDKLRNGVPRVVFNGADVDLSDSVPNDVSDVDISRITLWVKDKWEKNKFIRDEISKRLEGKRVVVGDGDDTTQERIEERVPVKEDLEIKYDMNELRKRISDIEEAIDEGESLDELFVFFLDHILYDYGLAVSAGKAEYEDYELVPDSITARVMRVAQTIDYDLYSALYGFLHLYIEAYNSGEAISQFWLEDAINKICGVVRTRVSAKRFMFGLLAERKINGKVRFDVLLKSVPVLEVFKFDKDKFEVLGLDRSYSDKIPLYAYIVAEHPFGEDSGAAGVFKGEGYVLGYLNSMSGLSPVDVMLHEIGHALEDMRISREEFAEHPNGELNSTLLPLLFSRSPKEYLLNELKGNFKLTEKSIYKKSIYVHACRGIINGILRAREDDERFRGIPELSGKFDADDWANIKSFVSAVNSLDDYELRMIGLELYLDLWQSHEFFYKAEAGVDERDYYLSSAFKGYYIRKRSDANSGSADHYLSEVRPEKNLPPNGVLYDDSADEDGAELKERNISIEDESGTEDGFIPELDSGGVEVAQPRIDEDVPVDDALDDDTSLLDDILEGADDDLSHSQLQERLKQLSPSARKLSKTIIQTFGKDVEELTFESEEGTVINIFRYILGQAAVFDEVLEMTESPELEVGVTLDVSSSIKHNDLIALFQDLAVFFSSTFHFAQKGNRKVSWSACTTGDRFDVIKGFKQKVNESGVSNTIRQIKRLLGQTTGIDVAMTLRGIVDEHKRNKSKVRNKLHFVLTDEETQDDPAVPSLLAEAESMGLDIVVLNFSANKKHYFDKYLALDKRLPIDDLVQIIAGVCVTKAMTGKVPKGDILKSLKLKSHVKGPEPQKDDLKALAKRAVKSADADSILSDVFSRGGFLSVNRDDLDEKIDSMLELQFVAESIRDNESDIEIAVITDDDPIFSKGWMLGLAYNYDHTDYIVLHKRLLEFAMQGRYLEKEVYMKSGKLGTLGEYILNDLIIGHELRDLKAGYHSDDINANDYKLLREFWAEYTFWCKANMMAEDVSRIQKRFLGDTCFDAFSAFSEANDLANDKSLLNVVVGPEMLSDRLYHKIFRPILKRYDGKFINLIEASDSDRCKVLLANRQESDDPLVYISSPDGFSGGAGLLDGHNKKVKLLEIDTSSTTHFLMFTSVLAEIAIRMELCGKVEMYDSCFSDFNARTLKIESEYLQDKYISEAIETAVSARLVKIAA